MILGTLWVQQILNELNLMKSAKGLLAWIQQPVYCTIKIPKVAEGNPQSCMRIFPIIADAFGISLRPQYIL